MKFLIFTVFALEDLYNFSIALFIWSESRGRGEKVNMPQDNILCQKYSVLCQKNPEWEKKKKKPY